MDRFIVFNQLDNVIDEFDLKSSMDRFIANDLIIWKIT